MRDFLVLQSLNCNHGPISWVPIISSSSTIQFNWVLGRLQRRNVRLSTVSPQFLSERRLLVVVTIEYDSVIFVVSDSWGLDSGQNDRSPIVFFLRFDLNLTSFNLDTVNPVFDMSSGFDKLIIAFGPFLGTTFIVVKLSHVVDLYELL